VSLKEKGIFQNLPKEIGITFQNCRPFAFQRVSKYLSTTTVDNSENKSKSKTYYDQRFLKIICENEYIQIKKLSLTPQNKVSKFSWRRFSLTLEWEQ